MPTFWEFMQGRCPRVQLQIDCRELPPAATIAPDADARRAAVADWVETLWQEKDQRIGLANGKAA